ncbi:hypothetical protein C5613_26650 [Rhodococcus opacus]|uniref:Uncharacterized protein n=1 Tax=Rhodococcus opacus TaxID=37919 RepID=A0A2S8J246_RHOOP|nr:hypothetical protein C5613_26650 [Rhodococcus opacus]
MTFVPCLVRSMQGSEVRALTLGHPLLDSKATSGRSSWPVSCPPLRGRMGSRSTNGSRFARS